MNQKKMRSIAVALIVGAAAGCSSTPISAPASAPSGGGAVAFAFSPGAGDQTAEALVLEMISSAKHSIHLAAYSFTSKPIAEALRDASRRGVTVMVVLDKSNKTAKYSGATFLKNAGIPVRIDSKYAIMHDKFMVIDGATVETGSFNYTSAAAEKNAENAIVIRGSAGVAEGYDAEWKRLWDESEEF